MLKQIVDGFSYNSNLLWLPNRFFPNALAQLDILRRAVNYRARWICVPTDIDEPVAPYKTEFYQFQVASGSILFGWSFCVTKALDPTSTPVTPNSSMIALNLTDNCTGQRLFEDYAIGGGLATDNSTRCYPNLLTQPRLILGSGNINAAVSNTTANTVTCQWLLHFAEPCRIIDETHRAEAERGMANVVATYSSR